MSIVERGPRSRPRPSDIAIVGYGRGFPGRGQRFAVLVQYAPRSSTPSPRFRRTAGTGGCITTPTPRPRTRSSRSGAGSCPTSHSTPSATECPPRVSARSSRRNCWHSRWSGRRLADAGYAERPFPREKTAVVLGMGGGAAQLAMGYAFRSYLPMLDTVLPAGGKQAIESCQGLLPEWTEDSFPGFLLNVTAGRIANRLNLGGANYTVDAACGSSLAAASLAVRELETGAADMVILGGVDTVQNPFTYLAFSKTQAFSPRGRCRPFDASADGIVISEGVAAVVLKRLADAERDGDRIYAVIKGVGASSDGRAPRPDRAGGRRADAGPRACLSRRPAFRRPRSATSRRTARAPPWVTWSKSRRSASSSGKPGPTSGQCVVGSVKSMIGHTKCAAGLAGLINASLALYHKVLPPTIGVETPNPKLDLREGPLRLCTQTQPWLHPHSDRPRRAGVSAFGFGGTNFHAVLEEYDRNLVARPRVDGERLARRNCWSGRPTYRASSSLNWINWPRALDSGARPALCDLSHTLIQAKQARKAGRRTLTGDPGDRGRLSRRTSAKS